LFAPIVMLQHSWYVLTIMLGISTGWGSQARDDRALPLAFVIRAFATHTFIGIAATVVLWETGAFGWYVPLLAGLWLAIPLVFFTSSPLLGRASRNEGFFLTPPETCGLTVLDRAHELAAAHQNLAADARKLVFENAQVRALHLSLLQGMPAPADRTRLWALREQWARADTSRFSREDWTLLLSDPESIQALAAPLSPAV
jgi:membrane glycosyltransferase